MATIERPVAITVNPELQGAVDRALKGVRDPKAMRQAAERMDRMREEMRQLVGDVDLAVPLIRATRDEVVLAEREGCELLTADDRLVRALQATFPFITPLSSLP